MIKVKYIDKIKDKHGIIQYYVLLDLQGNRKTVTSEILKSAIKKNEVECVNLKLTSDNRLIEKGENKSNECVVNQKKKSTPVEMYEEYMRKMRILGVKPDAEYRINDDYGVILTRVLVRNKTFIIQPFVTCIFATFKEYKELKLINKSNITDMSRLFKKCMDLERLDLSEFDTSKVTDMKEMFAQCKKLKELNLSNFNTSKVTHMNSMFQGCASLESVNVSSFDTSNVTDMTCMFNLCAKLKKIDLRNFNTSKVESMKHMFAVCKNLEKLDLSSFDTSKVDDLRNMFYDCEKLKGLDISRFNISQIESGYEREMFMGCKYKNTFKVPKELTRWIND